MTFSTMLSTMSVGILRTFAIFSLTLLGSLPLGFLVYFGRNSRLTFTVPWLNLRFRPISLLVRVYIAIMRGTPLMLQLLVWYFGPYYLWGASIRGYRFTAIILAFVFNYAAYFAEIYRGGIESIPAGQYEAAEVLGYTKSQTFFHIILPQVVKRVIPAVTNEVITLVKDTSMAFTLAYNEIFSIAKQIAASQTSFMPFVIAGVFYFVANYVVAFGMERIEKALSYYQ